MNRVVAAVDGSPASVAALHWAAGEARARAWPLVAITAWSFPAISILPMSPPPPTAKQLTREAGEMVKTALAGLGADLDGVEVERLVVEGSPGESLLAHVDASDVLVVGARGHGRVGSLLLGSVSRHCAEHAPCPVVIVHGESQAA